MTGVAWLSSARAVRCWVKSITSETFVLSCQRVMPGTLRRLQALSLRKVEMTSSHHGPYAQGYTRATMVGTKGGETVRWSKSPKANLSSD